jgi:NAD-dependent deacetylase
VPALEEAFILTETADYFAVIGTSFKYPAAGLIDFTNSKTPIYYDPNPLKSNLKSLQYFPSCF